MGLAKPALRFLAREHQRRPLEGDVLLWGRQCMYATFEEARSILVSEGIRPASLADGRGTRTNIADWRGTPRERYTSDVAFFEMLGASSVNALDCSDFEGAEYVWDLNTPVPQEWLGHFDFIVDSGTIEHIFDIRQAFMNVGRLLRPGGRVVHFTPANNYTNHGFYQCSPTLFADYYGANGFVNVRTFVAEERLRRGELAQLDVFEVEPDRQPLLMMSKRRLQVIVVAEKTGTSTIEQIPQQRIYSSAGKSNDNTSCADPVPTTLADRLRRVVPAPVKTFLGRYVIAGLHPHRKPWRLRQWSRLR